jgi:GNAT superfamily N-acetyltransferase
MSTGLVNNRELGLTLGYEATDWSTPISYLDYATAMRDWDIKVIQRNDSYIGAAFFRNDEIHVSVLPQWRGKWITRGLLRELFSADRVTTKVTPGHDYMFDILRRLGFVRLDDGTFVKGH